MTVIYNFVEFRNEYRWRGDCDSKTDLLGYVCTGNEVGHKYAVTK